MQNFNFEDCGYIVSIYYPNCSYVECYGCCNETEVYDAFTDSICKLIDSWRDGDPEGFEEILGEGAEGEENRALIYMAESHKISNPETVKYLYNLLYDDIFGMAFRVTDNGGDTLFSWGCD